MALKNRGKLWATTQMDGQTINIYLKDRISGAEAITYQDRVTEMPFVILTSQLVNKPEALDETLLHEWIHCIEYLFPQELRKPDPKDCSQMARVVSKYLVEALRNFKQV
jgi:hypothetical protein